MQNIVAKTKGLLIALAAFLSTPLKADGEQSQPSGSPAQCKAKIAEVVTGSSDSNRLVSQQPILSNSVVLRQPTAVVKMDTGSPVVVVTTQDRAKYSNYAESMIAGLLSADLNQSTEKALSENMGQIGSTALAVDLPLATQALDQTMESLSRSDVGKASAGNLLQLSAVIRKAGISDLFAAPPSGKIGGFLGMFKRTITNSDLFNMVVNKLEKANSAREIISRIEGELANGFNKEELELEVYAKDADTIRGQILVMLDKYAMLEELSLKGQAAYQNLLNTDATRAEFVKRHFLTPIAGIQLDVGEIVVVLQQAELALITLINTGRTAVDIGRRKVAKAKIIFTTGVVIANAIARQQKLVEGTAAVEQAANAMQTANAQNLLRHVVSLNKFVSDMSNIDILEQSHQQYLQIEAEQKRADEALLSTYQNAIPRVEKLRDEVEQVIKDKKKGREQQNQISSQVWNAKNQ